MKSVVVGLLLLFLTLSVKVYESLDNRFNDGKCRAISFEAGGVKGAYEIGALKALVDNLEAQEVAYDVVSGVSVGSINSAGLSLYKKGDEKSALDFLYQTWSGMTDDRVKKGWTGGIIDGILFRGALYNNAPLKETIAEVVAGHQIQRQLFISSCDANTAQYIVFDGSKLTVDDLPAVCQASAAIPGVFPPSQLNGRVLFDGGSIWNINAFSAIEGCRQLGYADKDIILDLLMNSYAELDDSVDISKFGTLEIYFRYLDITNYYKILDFVQILPLDYPDVNVRYVIHPDSAIASGLGVSFTPQEIADLQAKGEADGKKAIETGAEMHLQILREYAERYKGDRDFTESYNSYRNRRVAELKTPTS